MSPIAHVIVLASAALAQPAGRSDPEDVIEIIGRAPAHVREEATQYVRQLGIANGSRSAGRWIDAVCPHAIGLEPGQAANVEQQVRAVAQASGATVASSECKANLLLVFTADANSVVRSVLRKIPLGAASESYRQRLQDGEDPIRWWYSDELRSRDGSASGLPPPALRIESDGMTGTLSGALPSNDRATSVTQPGSSTIRTQVQRALTHATVVIDVHRAPGRSLQSLVHFAALVGLAEVKLGATAPNSILNLFGSREGPGELTVTDLAFLKALYAMHLDRSAEQHRRVLIGGIIRARTKP